MKIQISRRLLLGTLVLICGGFLFNPVGQQNEALAQAKGTTLTPIQGNVGPVSRINPFSISWQPNGHSLWTKELPGAERVVLSRHPIPYKPPTLAQLKAENPRAPANMLSDIPQPFAADQYDLKLYSKDKAPRIIWSVQRVKYKFGLLGHELQVLDVLRDGRSFIVAWKPAFGTAIDIVRKPPSKMTLKGPNNVESHYIAENEVAIKIVGSVELKGSLQNNTLVANLKWWSGAKSSWAYRRGKWIETVKYVSPPDPNVLRQQQEQERQHNQALLERRELEKSLAGESPRRAALILRGFDRTNGLLPPNTPDPTREELREEYKAALRNMSAEDIERAMKNWDYEMTPRKNPPQ